MIRIQWLLVLIFHAAVAATTSRSENNELSHELLLPEEDDRIPSRQRQLQWNAFNNLISTAVLNFPDTELSAGGMTLKVTNLRCSNVRVNNILLQARMPSKQRLVASTTISGLDMTCTARYDFSGFLIVNGSGDLYVESFQNSAITETVFASLDYTLHPPHDSWIQSCQPIVNINKLEFSNGGFWGWTLDTLEGLFRGRFEDMAESRLCDELRAMSSENLDTMLKEMKQHLARYPENIVIEPLASETALIQTQTALEAALVPTAPLINWKAPGTYPFGFFMEEAWKDMVTLLNKEVTLSSGLVGLNANLLLQQNVLDDGLLVMDIKWADQLVYSAHDQWTKTTIRAQKVRIRGLDTLTKLDPMVTIGQYTLQSKLSWQSLYLEVDLTIAVRPSTQPGSYISGGNGAGITESVTVQFSLSQVDAVISILLALDQADVEALQVGHLLEKDNILPCFLSSIYKTEVSALSVEAIDLKPPQVFGFVSQGLDNVISSAINMGFLMYESSMLRSSKAFFQTAIRDVVNESIEAQQQSYGVEQCTLLDLPAPHGVVDVRDLLLEPAISVWSGGAGLERYGDLFYGFVMPTLQKEVLTDDNINARFLRPFTEDQSGQGGVIDASNGQALFNFAQEDPNGSSWVGLLGYDLFQVRAFDAMIHNVDTITTPVSVLNPIDGMVVSNTVQTGDNTPDRPLRLTMKLAVSGRGRLDEVRDMANEVELSVTIPTTLIAADLLVAMNETSLLNFPLKDLENQFCWLAALTQGDDHPALNLEKIITSMASFDLDAFCVSCSSPGGLALPTVLETMKAAGLTTNFKPFLEGLLAELTQSAFTNMNFPAMIQDAPKLCPHQASFEVDAVASDSYGLANGLATAPQWSRQSVEAIAAIGFLAAYTSLFVVALNHLLQPDLETQRYPVTYFPVGTYPANQTLEGLTLLDWSDLSTTLGPWADEVFNEARDVLKVSVDSDSSASSLTNGNFSSSRRLAHAFTKGFFTSSNGQAEEGQNRRLQAQSFIRDNILDEEGSLDVPFYDLQADFAGISFSLKKARLHGLDSITHLDPFIVIGPQLLQNYMKLQQLNVSLELEVEMDQELSNLTVDFSFLDVMAEVPLLLAMDFDKLGKVEVGSLMQIRQILPCLLEGAQQAYIPQINLTIGNMERPSVGGSLSSDLMSAVAAVSDSLFDTNGGELLMALPGLFDTSIRRTLNNWLDQFVRKVDPAKCAVAEGGGTVDFRDLFLPKETSKALGGSGKQQYGDLFVTLHEAMQEELTTKSGEPPSFNDFLSSWTAEQSNVSGTMHVLGTLLNTTASMSLLGLNATLGIQLGDVVLENIDSLGSPLSLLVPLDEHILNNTATLGSGPDPLKVTARMMISLSDNKEMQVRNDVNVSIDIYEATAAATVLMRIAEDSLLKFPLKDITNSYCWISTILASSEDLTGIALVGHALRLQEMDLNVSCLSCTSPQFGDLVADLYDPADGEDATDTVLQTLGQILNGEAIQDYLDQIVMESSSRCPHSDDFDPSTVLTATDYLKNQGSPFGFTDFTTRSDRSSYFNIASGVFAACLLLFFVVGKYVVWRRNKKWKESLSDEGMYLLRHQEAKEQEQETLINMHSTSLLRSPHIPRNIRWMVPVLIVVNIILYMGGHLGVLSTVDVEVNLAGEHFTVHNFLVFSFLDSTANTYKNGGMEMSIMLWIFTGLWPYVKLLSSLYLWVVPPRNLSVSTRGRLLLWIDTLTKLSIIDIAVMIFFLAMLLVYIGGPDEALSADGALYSMKAIVIPGASLYCMVIAQRMSRVSSRFFLEYHDQDVAAARKACASGEITDKGDKKEIEATHVASNAPNDETILASRDGLDGPCNMSRLEEEEQQHDFDSTRSDAEAIRRSFDEGGDSESREQPSLVDAGDHKPAPEDHSLNVHDRECEDSTSSKSGINAPLSCLNRFRFFSSHLGVAFGGISVLVLATIGCIYAPSVSVEISDLWGLALEAETTFEEAATEYGVFFIVSSVLLKSRFVLDTTWDYVALGFLFTVAFISVGMVFFVGCYNFLKRLVKEGWTAIKPNKESSTMKLPSYLSLYAYKHIEIYVVAVVIGCGQLGSVSIYAIHLYCSILDSVYRVLTYIGLAQPSTAQCFEAQMTIPHNLLIFFGALLILLVNFSVQSSKQYRKNIDEACELLRHEDHNVEHLSSLWNTPSKKGKSFWSSSRHLLLNRTATFSEEYSAGNDSPSSYRTAKSSSPIEFIAHCPSPDDTVSVSTIGGSPVRKDANGVSMTSGSFSGSPSFDDHRVLASVEQYSTPQ